VDLHLIYRIYLAGGPDNLNHWSQDLIRNRGSVKDGISFVEIGKSRQASVPTFRVMSAF